MNPAAEGVALSFSQESLWFLEQFHPATARHNITSAWQLSGPLDVVALRRALGTVSARHSALRTVFGERAGRPCAWLEERGAELEECDWTGFDEAGRTAALAEACQRPFDLSRETPARFLLARPGAGEWVLLLQFHHIAMDGWSLGVVLGEVSDCYEAYRRGEEPRLEAVEVEFHEHALSERARLSGEELEQLARPCLERLAGVGDLMLPARAAGDGLRGGGDVFHTLDAGLMEEVGAFARQTRTTPNAVYLAALEALLARYSGQRDFAVATVYANRGQPELERAVGYFVNTLVVRAELAGQPSFRALAGRVSASLLDALDAGELPFSHLVEKLRPSRGRAGDNPLLRVLYSYQSFPAGGLRLPGVEARELLVETTGEPPAELSLTLTPGAGQALLWLRYSTRVFDAAMARRFAAHYERLLRAALARPDAPVEELEFLDDDERRRLITWGTGPAAGAGGRVEEAVSAQARLRPHHVAVRDGQRTLTYTELERNAARVAGALAARGVRPGSTVGVLAARGAGLVECWLAVLKAGCAYVPLDPADPVDRLRGQLADCGAAALLALSPPPAALAAAVAVVLDLTGPPLPDEAPPAPSGKAHPAACVLFSSGSTGRPKGALVPHAGILRLLLDNGYEPFSSEDRWLFMAPPSFDASTLEVWGALANGGMTVVMPAGIPTLAALGETIRRERITVLWLTSSLFNAIIDDEPEMLAGVRLVMTGGEALSAAHVRKALQLLPATRLMNGYGPTENTTFTTTWEIPRGFDQRAARVPIGRPIAGTRVYVLDAARRLVPAGVAGELYAAGDGVALGYAGLPELTAEKFVPDPFGAHSGARMYRTGDVARWLEPGVLDFLGRIDDQVKIRGHRVEPGELEAALAAHPAVGQAAVVVGEDAATGKFLMAFYTVRRPVAAAELRRHLEGRLPAWLQPRDLMEVAALPLLPSGKVDRAALSGLRGGAGPTSSGGMEPPHAGLEEQVASLWRRLLGRKIVSRHDNFFDLGGNSLAAVRLVALLRRELDARLQVSDVFLSPTLSALAAVVARGSAPRKTPVVLQAEGHAAPLLSLSAGPRFRNLARCFAPERPVLGIPTPDLRGLAHPVRCEELAERYAEWILTARPEGPWILTGWCLAGVVAYAVARLLSARGPGALVLLDSPCPAGNRRPPRLQRLARSARRALHHGRILASGRHGGLLPYLSERMITMKERRSLRMFEARYERAGEAATSEAGFDFQDLFNFAALRYVPASRLDWPVLLLRARDQPGEFEGGDDWGWLQYASNFEVVWSAGDHGTIFEAPHVEESARLIRDWLGRQSEIS